MSGRRRPGQITLNPIAYARLWVELTWAEWYYCGMVVWEERR